MGKFAVLIALALGLGSTPAFAIKYVVVEGKELCAFYSDPNGCYQQAIQMITSAADTGKIENNGKECVFPSGGKIVSRTDINWMFAKQPPGDWNFDVLNADGTRRLQFQKIDSEPGSGFRISGNNSSGVHLQISFAGMSRTAIDNRIQGTVTCNMNFGTGDVVYVMNIENLYEAQRSCPKVIGNIEATPGISYEYTQFGSDVQVRPYISRAHVETNLFVCRNK